MIEINTRISESVSMIMSTGELSGANATQYIAMLMGRLAQIIDQSLDEIVQQLNNEIKELMNKIDTIGRTS